MISISCHVCPEAIIISIIIIITSNDDIQPSTVITNQSPSGLIFSHIKAIGLYILTALTSLYHRVFTLHVCIHNQVYQHLPLCTGVTLNLYQSKGTSYMYT